MCAFMRYVYAVCVCVFIFQTSVCVCTMYVDLTRPQLPALRQKCVCLAVCCLCLHGNNKEEKEKNRDIESIEIKIMPVVWLLDWLTTYAAKSRTVNHDWSISAFIFYSLSLKRMLIHTLRLSSLLFISYTKHIYEQFPCYVRHNRAI